MTTTLEKPKRKRPPRMRDIVFGDAGKSVDESQRAKWEADRAEAEAIIHSAHAEDPDLDAGGTLELASVTSIDPSPYQPRTEFDSTELAELCASIQTHGLAQPLLVRRHPQNVVRYELVAGERRLRAAKMAGLKQVPCLVRDLTDDQAAEICLVENLQRKDLSAIDEARGYKQYLERTQCTQQQLAERVGVTQGQISNRIRLLELPAKIQSQIISGAITASLARPLVPYMEHKPIADAIAQRLVKPKYRWQKPPQTEDDVDELLGEVLNEFGDLDKSDYVWETGGHVNMPRLTDEQRKELNVVTIPDPGGKGTCEVALNKKAFDKLWKQVVADAKQRKKKKGDRKEQKAAKVAKQLTPAELKARKAKQAKLLATAIGRWKTDWLRHLCADAIESGKFPRSVWSVIFWATTHHHSPGLYAVRGNMEFSDREERMLKNIRPSVTDRDRATARLPRGSVLKQLLAIDSPSSLEAAATSAVAGWLWDEKDGPQPFLPPAEVELLAESLKIDLTKEWDAETKTIPERTTSATLAGFLDLHTRDQLVDQAAEWKIELNASLPKSGMIGHLTTPGRRLKIPKALLKARCQ